MYLISRTYHLCERREYVFNILSKYSIITQKSFNKLLKFYKLMLLVSTFYVQYSHARPPQTSFHFLPSPFLVSKCCNLASLRWSLLKNNVVWSLFNKNVGANCNWVICYVFQKGVTKGFRVWLRARLEDKIKARCQSFTCHLLKKIEFSNKNFCQEFTWLSPAKFTHRVSHVTR